MNPTKALKVAGELIKAGEHLRVGTGQPIVKEPATPVAFFLSYSSTDVLVARQVYDDLRQDAKATAWFDLAQSPDPSRRNDTDIAKWLEQSVHGCQGFVLVLSKHALESDWVEREIDAAVANGVGRGTSHLLLLKTAEVPLPEAISAAGKVVDCDGIWWSRGISEELFAAIYGRKGRKTWLGDQPGTSFSEGHVLHYEDFATDAGTVTSFDWRASPCTSGSFRRKDISWSLEYERRSGETVRVVGGGEDKPADLGMTKGNRIASVKLHRRWGVDLMQPLPLWMRSDSLALSPDAVLDHYFAELDVNDEFRPSRARRHEHGFNALGRELRTADFQDSDDRWRTYETLAWAMLKRGTDPKLLLRQLTAVGLDADTT